MPTMFLTVRRVKGDCTTRVADGGVMLFEPRDPQDDMVSSRCNIESDVFVIVGNLKNNRTEMGEIATGRGTTVSENQGNGTRLWETRDLGIAFNKFVINKATLSSRIYQSSRRN
jgi:hypothetical protein